MASEYDVQCSADRVEGWAQRRLPFEPKGWLLDYRNALRAGLKGLHRPSPALYCCYTAQSADLCDVENVLLYNVGISAFAGVGLRRVVAERRFDQRALLWAAPDGEIHHHLFSLTVPNRPAEGTLVAEWPSTSFDPPFRVERVWSALKRTALVNERIDPALVHLGLRLEVTHPDPLPRPALLSALKVLVDGAIASLHAHDGTELEVVSGRLADRLGHDRAATAADLIDDTTSALGTRRLIWPFGNYVQWNPADDGIVYLDIAAAPGDHWRIAGSLHQLPNDGSWQAT